MRKPELGEYPGRELERHIVIAVECPDDRGFSFCRFNGLLAAADYIIYSGRVGNSNCFWIGTIGSISPAGSRNVAAGVARVLDRIGVERQGGDRMDFRFERTYRGPIKAVVVDLAGTVVDYGCRAPTEAFMDLFDRRGIEVTTEQVREPMGMQKRAHIRAMTRMPTVSEQWQSEYGRPCNDDDIDSMYDEFVPLQIEVLSRHSAVIPGAVRLFEDLRGRGIAVAGTTGYNEQMMRVVLDAARNQGLAPDAAVCSEQVSAGRPAPWMIYRAMELLEVYPREAVVKIGDTIADIAAGLNAGVWTVGVAKTGNMLGLGQDEIEVLPENELSMRLETACEEMYAAGAHEVVDSVADALPVINRIEGGLRAGEGP